MLQLEQTIPPADIAKLSNQCHEDVLSRTGGTGTALGLFVCFVAYKKRRLLRLDKVPGAEALLRAEIAHAVDTAGKEAYTVALDYINRVLAGEK